MTAEEAYRFLIRRVFRQEDAARAGRVTPEQHDAWMARQYPEHERLLRLIGLGRARQIDREVSEESDR